MISRRSNLHATQHRGANTQGHLPHQKSPLLSSPGDGRNARGLSELYGAYTERPDRPVGTPIYHFNIPEDCMNPCLQPLFT